METKGKQWPQREAIVEWFTRIIQLPFMTYQSDAKGARHEVRTPTFYHCTKHHPQKHEKKHTHTNTHTKKNCKYHPILNSILTTPTFRPLPHTHTHIHTYAHRHTETNVHTFFLTCKWKKNISSPESNILNLFCTRS